MAVALDLHVLADRRPSPGAPRARGRCARGRRASRARPAPSDRAGAPRRAGRPRGRRRRAAACRRSDGSSGGRPRPGAGAPGDAPTTSKAGVRVKNRYGLGLTRRSARYSAIPSSGAPVAGSAGRSNDWRRARTTWIASPAAIASLATSTARMYSSRPRLVSIGRPARSRRGRRRRPAATSRRQLGRRSAARSARGPRRWPSRRSGSAPRGSGASVWSEAIADRVWVRWSKTSTRSVSMKAAVGTPTGSRSGSGTVGSKAETAS